MATPAPAQGPDKLKCSKDFQICIFLRRSDASTGEEQLIGTNCVVSCCAVLCCAVLRMRCILAESKGTPMQCRYAADIDSVSGEATRLADKKQ